MYETNNLQRRTNGFTLSDKRILVVQRKLQTSKDMYLTCTKKT